MLTDFFLTLVLLLLLINYHGFCDASTSGSSRTKVRKKCCYMRTFAKSSQFFAKKKVLNLRNGLSLDLKIEKGA